MEHLKKLLEYSNFKNLNFKSEMTVYGTTIENINLLSLASICLDINTDNESRFVKIVKYINIMTKTFWK